MMQPLLFCLDQYLFNMKKYKLILTAILLHFCSLGQLTNEFITLKPLYVNSIQFNYTGSIQSWTVPTNVTSIKVEVYGAQGGDHPDGFVGGKGGLITGFIPVTPGTVLYFTVGGKPTSKDAVYGFGGNGGYTTNNSAKIALAGGGLSCISTTIPINHSNVIAVAGGGGGAATGFSGNGGDAGGVIGSDGIGNYGGISTKGKGGTQIAGGAGGSPYDSNNPVATSGTALQGGNGAIVSVSTWAGGGGGGGGYFGGGGGAGGGNAVGSGGGGSSFASPSLISTTNTAGVNSGHGKIIIYY
jgi:hypothetical protein